MSERFFCVELSVNMASRLIEQNDATSNKKQTAPRPYRRQSFPDECLPPISPFLFRAFTLYVTRYLRQHFHTVRLARSNTPSSFPAELPVIIFINHPSWWDPLFGLFLTSRCFPDRRVYAPIEAAALARYQFFARIGFFGVEPGTVRGAATFLRVGQAILSRPNSILGVTPEGQFTDPRERPVHMRSGLGHLAGRLRTGVLLPLALEYPFWEERLPEALARFGEPIFIASENGRSSAQWTTLLAQRLEAAQDALAFDARQRDRAAFEILLGGSAGVGGVYDMWRSLRARLRGEQFRREHGATEL